MLIDHDDPLPYHGVAEMVARSKATLLAPWEVKQVSDEHPGERACRADGPRTHDPEAIAEMERFFDGLGPEWQELFAELDRRDPNMRQVKERAESLAMHDGDPLCESCDKPVMENDPTRLYDAEDGVHMHRACYERSTPPEVATLPGDAEPEWKGVLAEMRRVDVHDEPSAGDVADAVARAK